MLGLDLLNVVRILEDDRDANEAVGAARMSDSHLCLCWGGLLVLCKHAGAKSETVAGKEAQAFGVARGREHSCGFAANLSDELVPECDSR